MMAVKTTSTKYVGDTLLTRQYHEHELKGTPQGKVMRGVTAISQIRKGKAQSYMLLAQGPTANHGVADISS